MEFEAINDLIGEDIQYQFGGVLQSKMDKAHTSGHEL